MAKAKNILLMFLSTMVLPDKKEIDLAKKRQRYLLETDVIEEDCVQTNEAVVYDVVNLLKNKKESLDAIFFFATDQVQHQKVRIVDGKTELYASITQREFLEQRWKARCKELSGTQFYCVDYSYPAKDAADADTLEVDLPGESSRRVTEMAEAVKSLGGPRCGRRQWNTYELYVDITGGFRHATMMMTSLVQLLQYNGMKLKKLLYSDFQPGRRLNKVFDFTEIGRQYRLINGAEEFARFGSVYNIEKYFGAHYDPKKDSLRVERNTTPALEALLLTMHRFSNAIHLCATNKIQECMDELRQSVAAFRDNPSQTSRESLFRQLFDTIYEKYGVLLQKSARETDIIRWCLDKGFYQQALTLYVEWMPILFVREKILYPANETDMIAKYRADQQSRKSSGVFFGTWQRYFVAQYPYQKEKSYLKGLDAMFRAKEALVAQNMKNDATSILQHYREVSRIRNAVNHAGVNADAPSIDEIVRNMQQWLDQIDKFCATVQKSEAPSVLPVVHKDIEVITPSEEKGEKTTCALSTSPTTLPPDGEAPSGQQRSDTEKSSMCRFPRSVPSGAKKTWRWRRIKQLGRSRPCTLPPFSAKGNSLTALPWRNGSNE